jgi:hypothetical protein
VTHFPDHSLKIGFWTYIYGRPVAWKYRVFQQQTDMTWKKLADVKGNGSTAPSSLTLTPAQAAGTHRYRVRAGNPIGWSQATDV